MGQVTGQGVCAQQRAETSQAAPGRQQEEVAAKQCSGVEARRPKGLEMREANSALRTVPGMEPNVSSPCKMLSVPMKMAVLMLQPHRDLVPSHSGQWLLLCDGDASWENRKETKTVISLCKGTFTGSFSEDQK